MPGFAAFMRLRPTVMAPTPTMRGRAHAARLRPGARLWTRGVDHALFRPRRRPASRPAAADLSLCRPGRGREESRGAARARPARLDRHRRRWAGAGLARAPLPARAFPRRKARRSARGRLRQRRRLRVSLPHRHVRHRPDRGDGERPAGRGLSGPGSDRRRRAGRRGRPRPGPARRLPRGAGDPARGGARIFAALHLEGERATVPRERRDRPPEARASRVETARLVSGG